MGYTDTEKRRKAVEYMSGKNLKINEERVAHVTNFLDTYFDSSADMAPEGRDVRVIHFTCHELYVQYYIPYCSDPLTFRKCAVAETDFNKIR